jgi:hypothetical protein
MSRCGTIRDYLFLVAAVFKIKETHKTTDAHFSSRFSVSRNDKEFMERFGRKVQEHFTENSYQPVFLWALKLYAFCNKNIKKHGREFMLKYRKFWGFYKSIHPSLMLHKLLLKSCVRTACFSFFHTY